MISLSRTGRPLTNKYCPSALARVSDGAAAKPSTTTPSRSARTSIALDRKSAPKISPSRVSRPAAPGSAAAQVTGARSSPASVKAASGLAMARPDVAYTLAGEERAPVTWAAALPGAAGRLTRLGDILGADFRSSAIEVRSEREGVVVEGFAAAPSLTR